MHFPGYNSIKVLKFIQLYSLQRTKNQFENWNEWGSICSVTYLYKFLG